MEKRVYHSSDPLCLQLREDCFGWQDGRCVILSETYGPDEKPCPFYAKKCDVEARRKKEKEKK